MVQTFCMLFKTDCVRWGGIVFSPRHFRITHIRAVIAIPQYHEIMIFLLEVIIPPEPHTDPRRVLAEI